MAARKRESQSALAERQLKQRQASALASALKTMYEPRNSLIKQVREMRFMERDVYVPSAYQNSTVQIRTPLMNDLVQRLAGALSVNVPQIKVPPKPKGDQSEAQRNSSKLEKWTQAFLIEIEHQENDRLFYRFLDYLCGDGHGVLKLIHKNEFWDELPELDEDGTVNPKEYLEERMEQKTGMKIPFSLKVIDPLTFYPRYSEAGLQDVMEISKRPRIYVAREFGISGWSEENEPLLGQKVDTDNLNLQGDCEYWEHWTDKTVDYYVDGVWIMGIDHGYDRIPYFHAKGTQTSSRDPGKEGLSVGHQLLHLIPALDSLLTMKTNSAFISAYPAFKRERDFGAPMRPDDPNFNEDMDGNTASEEFEPGHIYDGLPGESLEPIQLPGVGKDVDDSIQVILGIIDKVGVPSVLSGNHSPNRVSGYAYSEMLNVSRTKYTTIIRNAAFAYEQMIKFLWWLIEHKIGEPVPIWGDAGEDKENWLPLGPRDLKGYYAVKVIIEPLLPEDDIAQGQHAAAMVQAGLWSKRYAREMKMGVAAPEDMEDEILVERAMEMPQLQMYLLMKALERMDMDELAEVFQMTAQMAEQSLIDATKGAQGSGAAGPGQQGLPNMAPGTGGAGSPPPPGMQNGGSPNPPPPGPPGVSPV